MSGALERRVGIAGQGDGSGAALAGEFEGGEGEGSSSAGGDAEDDVILGGLRRDIFVTAGWESSSLISEADARAFAPPAMMNWTERGSVLKVAGTRRRRGPDAAAGSGADVDEASTTAESGGDQVDARAISGRARVTARATVTSSALMRAAISRDDFGRG